MNCWQILTMIEGELVPMNTDNKFVLGGDKPYLVFDSPEEAAAHARQHLLPEDVVLSNGYCSGGLDAILEDADGAVP